MQKFILEREEVGDTGVFADARAPLGVLPTTQVKNPSFPSHQFNYAMHTFLAFFLSLRLFAAEAFEILALSRVGVRFEVFP